MSPDIRRRTLFALANIRASFALLTRELPNGVWRRSLLPDTLYSVENNSRPAFCEYMNDFLDFRKLLYKRNCLYADM